MEKKKKKIGGDKDISHSGALLRSRNFFTWVEFLLYWTPSGDSTTTLLPDLSSTRYGSGLKVGVNLFSGPVLTIQSHLLSHHFRGHSVSHQHTAFLSPWLHCLYLKLLDHPLGILQSLVYGFAAFCGTAVLQGLLQLCCVQSFGTLLGKNQVLLSNFSSLFVQSFSSSVGNGSVFLLLRLPEAKVESLICVQCVLHQQIYRIPHL